MEDVVVYVQEGGWSMYPVACFGFLGLFLSLAALAALLAPSRKFPIGIGLAAMLTGLIALGMGLAGTMLGRQATDDALAVVGPEYAEEIRTRGYEESDNNLVLGALSCALPLLTGALALARGATMKTEKRDA